MLNFPFENQFFDSQNDDYSYPSMPNFPFSDYQNDDYSYPSMSNFPFENQSNENEIELLRKKKRNHSRCERDNALRKIKVDFHKFIIKFLNSVYMKGKFKKKKFVRFAGYFQNDVTIRTNKLLLNLPISGLLTKVEAYKNLGDINKKLYDKIKNEQNDENEDYFSWTYEDFYKRYLRSEEVEKLKKKEGVYIQKTLVTFITYFKSKEPRKDNSKKSKLYTFLFE